jgi:hypothetical protein
VRTITYLRRELRRRCARPSSSRSGEPGQSRTCWVGCCATWTRARPGQTAGAGATGRP